MTTTLEFGSAYSAYAGGAGTQKLEVSSVQDGASASDAAGMPVNGVKRKIQDLRRSTSRLRLLAPSSNDLGGRFA
eukprot:6121056-Pleurochrysis_carterae.AAC.3